MKRNHDFSSSDSELDENIEVEKESADENGYVCVQYLGLRFYCVTIIRSESRSKYLTPCFGAV